MVEVRKRSRKDKKKLLDKDEKSSGRLTRHTKLKTRYIFIGIGLVILGLIMVHGVFYPSSAVHHHVARFLSMVTSQNDVSDHLAGTTVYAIMMDAGSTGSRILVFTFKKSPTDGSLHLLDEFFKEVKPGISSYADNPAQAAESIRQLFDDAKNIIPEEAWATTPATLKATAGLRLLPGHQADVLIQQISRIFQNSGFLVAPNAVSIIDGYSEGLYLWTTINFLLDRLKNRALNETVAVVDMGGGSTQVAFVPVDQDTMQRAPPDDIHSIQLLGNPAKFYIRSYLNLGLMAMRLWTLQHTNQTVGGTANHFITPCFHTGVQTQWEFQGKTYTIEGIDVPEDEFQVQQGYPIRFLVCRLTISQLIAEHTIYKSDEMKQRSLFAVSYYFDRAVEANLISAQTGGSIKVKDFCQAAHTACQTPNPQQAFSCIDLTYLCTILDEGFQLSENQTVNLFKKIDGHETSWALGAALFDLDHGARQQTS